MKPEELVKHVLWGRLLLVGEYRGSKAEKRALMDKKNGEAIWFVRAIHLLECRCRGNLDRAVVYERFPDVIEEPDEAIFPYERGRMYAFFVECLKNERGQIIAFADACRKPELLDLPDGWEADAVFAPLGAKAVAVRNLV